MSALCTLFDFLVAIIFCDSVKDVYKRQILKEEEMNAKRGRSQAPVKKEIPTHIATAPNRVWTCDITWLNASIKGMYYKLYLIIDMFSRFIVAYEVWLSLIHI